MNSMSKGAKAIAAVKKLMVMVLTLQQLPPIDKRLLDCLDYLFQEIGELRVAH